MKKLIFILTFLAPMWVFAQDFRIIDWKTNVLNVQLIETDTFKFEAEPVDYNDPGAITREIGNYFIDFSARCFKIIGSDATTITVVDLEHVNLAPQSNQIGRVYQSIVDADSMFHSIGGVDISAIDELSRWKDVARNNEHFGRKIKDLDGRDTASINKSIRHITNDLDTVSTNELQTISTDGNAGNITLSNSGNTLNLNVNDHSNRTALDNVSGVNTGDQTSVSGQAGYVANSVTFNNSGSGDESGATFNGSTAKTVSSNTIGALNLNGGTMNNTNLVSNLNADLLDGFQGERYAKTTYDLLANNIDFNTVSYNRDNIIQSQPFHVPNYTGQTNYPEREYGQIITFNSERGLFPFQIAASNTGRLYFRGTEYHTTNPYTFSGNWRELWHSGNLTNPLSANSSTFTANRLIKATGTGNQVQETGITVDVNNNLTAPTAQFTGLAGVGTRLSTASSDGTLGVISMGSGGGVDADLLDGLNSIDFLKVKVFTGTETTVSANDLTDNGNYYAYDNAYITTNFINFPNSISAGGFGLLNAKIGSDYNFQIFQRYCDLDNLYYRSSYYRGDSGGKVYSNWRKIWNDGNLTNPLSANASSFTANRLIKATGTGNQVQETGISVDVNNNLTAPSATLTTGAFSGSILTGDASGNISHSTVNQAIGGNALISGRVIKFNGSTLDNMPDLSGTGTRPIGATSDGTLAVITNDYAVDSSAIKRHITNDLDTVSTNEIQDLTRSNDTIYLSSDVSPVVLNDFQHDTDTLIWDATLSDLGDSIAALRAIIPTVETTATIKVKLGTATNSTDGYLLATDWTAFNAKQAALVSGTNIKTINSTSILGSGNIAIAPMVYPSAGIAVSTGSTWGTSITDNSANWNRAYTIADSLKNDVLDTSSVNINKPNWTKFIQSVTAVQGIPKVGDFYGGGYVYYVSTSGTYGYCVYPDVIGTGSCYYSPTNNGSRITSNASVGGGIANTTAIVAVFGAGNYAAYRCDTLTKAGYTDWALPSSGDMDLIHDSLYSRFTAYGYYFTSTESGASNAYGYYFSPTGEFSDVSKAFLYSDYKTLAIRRFTVSPQTFNLSVSESDGSPSYSGINAMQFANCTLTQPTSNTVLITPTSGGSMTGDQIVAALNANDSTTLTKAIYSPELGMKNTNNEAYNYFWSAYYDDGYNYGIYLSQSPKGGYSRKLRYEANNNILYVPKLNLESGSYASSIGTGAATGSSTTKLVTEDMLVKTVQASGGGDMMRSTYDTGYNGIVDNSEKLGGQLPSYYMPNVPASSVGLGGVQISSTDGGLAMSGNYLLQKDNILTTRTPEASDYIAFYDNSATAQGKMTLSTLGSLIGGSGAVTSVTGTAPIISSGGTTPAISISAATTSSAGSMSASDKTKLDGFRSITPQYITTSASCATYCNFYTSASGSKTITFSNLIEGLSGQVEVSYSAASVITFAASGYTVMVASNIYNGTTGQVTSKSSGTAIYSYYVRNLKIYINGTQTYN